MSVRRVSSLQHKMLCPALCFQVKNKTKYQVPGTTKKHASCEFNRSDLYSGLQAICDTSVDVGCACFTCVVKRIQASVGPGQNRVNRMII